MKSFEIFNFLAIHGMKVGLFGFTHKSIFLSPSLVTLAMSHLININVSTLYIVHWDFYCLHV